MKSNIYNKLTTILMAILLIFSGMHLPLVAENMNESNSEITSVQEENTNSDELETSSEEENVSEEPDVLGVSFDENQAPHVSPYGAGFATFDGVDLSGNTELTYTKETLFGSALPKYLKFGVHFPDTVTSGKQVEITLAKEMGIQVNADGTTGVPGLKKVAGNFVYDANLLTTQLQGVISKVSFTKQPSSSSWNGYVNPNSGTIVISFIDGVSDINALEIVLNADYSYFLHDHLGDDYVINNVLTTTVSMQNGSQIIDADSLEKIRYTSKTDMLWTGGGSKNYYVDKTENLVTHNLRFEGRIRAEYIQMQYSYPKELTFTGLNYAPRLKNSNATYEVDTTSSATENYIIITVNHVFFDWEYLGMKFDVNTPQTVGTIYNIRPVGKKVLVKPYEAEVFEYQSNLPGMQMAIIETFKNEGKVLNSTHTVSLQNQKNQKAILGQIPISNLQSDAITNQEFKLTFDDQYW